MICVVEEPKLSATLKDASGNDVDYIANRKAGKIVEIVVVKHKRQRVSVQDIGTGEYAVLEFAEIDSGDWHKVARSLST